jgi:FkbM family methyltransferase
MQMKIVSHHVGGRGAGFGSIALPIQKAFEADILNVLYDADPECIPQTQNWWNANTNVATEVYPYCIWGADETITFRFTYDPYASSIFPTNPRYAHYYLPFHFMDYVFGLATEPMEERQVEARSLDSLVQEGSLPVPDFLSLDTQGSEFEILTGAIKTVRGNVLAIMTEFAFAEAYKNQKTFPALHTWLQDEGFELFEMTMQNYAPARAKLGARGKAVPLFGDALYVRRLDSLPPGDQNETTLRLYKLAAIAAWFGHVEYSLEALEMTQINLDSELESAMSNLSYFQFLTEMRAAAAKMNFDVLPTFNEHLTFEQSKARFDPNRKLRKKGPYRSRFARALRFDIHPIKKILLLIESHRQRLSETELERVFLRYGLDKIAALLKNRREWYGVR